MTASLADDASETGLSEAEAKRRLEKRGRRRRRGTGRSYLSIVVANVFTVFNLILVVFGVITLVFGDARDALFLGILVVNSGIGIFQEVRAKRAVDRLSLVVAARANVVRDSEPRSVPVEDVVRDDVVRLGPGDQVIADGVLLRATDLRLDESSLTGESEPVARGVRDEIRSGAYVVEGTAAYRVTAVGDDSFASRITGEARSFRHPRSPLQQAIDRLLYVTVVLVVLLGTLLGFALHHRHASTRTAAATSTAGVVSLVPEGLIVLVSITYAAAAYRMSRRGVLAQQLNAIESLASVDTLCTDKTGTLTEATLRVVDLLPASGRDVQTLREMLGAFAASASNRNATLEAIAEACPAEPREILAEVPFSSRRRWSAIQFADGSFYLGAPGRIPPGDLGSTAEEQQDGGRRVVMFARGESALPADAGERPEAGLEPWGLVVLAEQLRPHVRETIAYLLQQDIDIKILSGDSSRTAAAIAGDVGVPVKQAVDGSAIPEDPEARRRFAAETT
ncbi:MAG: HAD-IC family P-type ATPase, partial [Solirubrobacterales bacterium]|nr:HAD-IC family P-type ATPase [Solirubrobacterales bacterium]